MLVPKRRIDEDGLKSENQLPFLSLIITAHNEAERIRPKLENSLNLEYPLDRLEIIVASDFSSDNTDEIVESFADKGILLVRSDARKGKEYAQLCAIQKAKGDILVFSDVATQIEPDSLIRLAEYFDDEKVGAISSEDSFVSQDGSIVGEGAYVKYEMWLRRLESVRGGLVGLSGSFFAAKKQVCEKWDISVPSDFNTALNCAQLDLVAISCSDVIGIYQDVKNPALEYRRKNRTIIRGISAIFSHPEVLNPFKMGLFAFQVWSHKIMRWAEPWFMLAFFVITLLLFNEHWFYKLVLGAQMSFYALVITGHFSKAAREYTIIKIPYFFVQVNVAIAHATVQYLLGKRITVWEPSKR